MAKLTTEQAACNLIKSRRKYSKKLKSKGISTELNIDDNIPLRNIICLKHNINTKTDTASCFAIGYKRIIISPETHQKLKCTNKHAIDYLNKQREIVKKIQRRNKYE